MTSAVTGQARLFSPGQNQLFSVSRLDCAFASVFGNIKSQFYTHKKLDFQGFAAILDNKKDLKEFSSSRSDFLFWRIVIFALCRIMTFAP